MQSFLMTLSQLRNGQAIAQYETELAEVVAAVKETGKAGKLTITLEVAPLTNDDTTMNVSDKSKVDLPRQKVAGSTIMYAVEGGKLSRRDPRQPDLFPKKVVSNEVIDEETGEIITNTFKA